MCKDPMVSVLMSAYNVEPFINEAIDSVLSQSFTDFELIVIDDGSTDKTQEIIRSYKDERIVLLCNDKNLGLIDSLNKGIEAAKGKYIARFDSDDIMLPERLKIQVKYLENHPDIGLVTGQSVCMKDGIKTGIFKNSIIRPELEVGLLAKCTISHTCVTLRRELLIKSGLRYSKEYLYMEDYGLWCNLLMQTKYAAQKRNFAVYRRWGGSITNTVYTEREQIVKSSRRKVLLVALEKFNIKLSDEEFDVYADAMCFDAKKSDHLVLQRAMKSVLRQLPPPYKMGRRLLFIYYLSIWRDATEGKSWKNCKWLSFCGYIWNLCKTAEKIWYRKMKIKVKY